MRQIIHSAFFVLMCFCLSGCATRELARQGMILCVVDMKGQPVAGAEVTVVFEDDQALAPGQIESFKPATLFTNADGRVRLAPLIRGRDSSGLIDFRMTADIDWITVKHDDFQTFESERQFDYDLDEVNRKIRIHESDFWSTYPNLKVVLEEPCGC